MAKQVIMAVAGAGKTYHICHMIDVAKKNLILAFTHENIHNILNELLDAHGHIPELTTVMTFDSFVYRYLVCPYEPSIGAHFGVPDFKSKGITTIDPPPQTISVRGGRIIRNPKYASKDKLAHYVNANREYYCATISELVLQVKQKRDTLIKRASKDIGGFFDQIMIDEFQDFREYDYDLIINLSKWLNNILLVGDYYQHSVSATNNTGKPFKKGKTSVSFPEFIQSLCDHGFVVDTQTLSKSRRCSASVCDFVTTKLGIQMKSHDNHCGDIIWVDRTNLFDVLSNPEIPKLVYKDARVFPYNAINWSYSKGDTMEKACVILTDRFEDLDCDQFKCDGIPLSTLNKLYVALTRPKGDLYLVKLSVYREAMSTTC